VASTRATDVPNQRVSSGRPLLAMSSLKPGSVTTTSWPATACAGVTDELTRTKTRGASPIFWKPT
jgi:hypothetical protein